MKAICTTCGKEFEKRGNTKTCGEECSPTPYRPRKTSVGICVICGATFQKTTNSAKTCGEECRRENTRRYMREFSQRPDRQEMERERLQLRHREKLELRGPIVANCAVCGSEYHKVSRSLTCSAECREVYRAGEWARRFDGHAAGHVKKAPQLPSEILPFPDDIDRESFGHWLSGITDGEGCFKLRVGTDPGTNKKHFYVSFNMTLRDDDADTLKLIQSYWGCGSLSFNDNQRGVTNAKPICCYGVQRVSDLAGIVVPHFERFPLRAKKREDFAIWAEAVRLMDEVQQRPTRRVAGRNGIVPKWTAAERERFVSLSARLKEQRRYADPVTRRQAAPFEAVPARNS